MFFIFGNDLTVAKSILNRRYNISKIRRKAPKPKRFNKLKTKPVIYFFNSDTLQAELSVISKGPKFNKRNLPYSNFLNFYLSSVFKEEIRTKRSLAYSAWATYYDSPEIGGNDYFQLYVGTQADKVPEALKVMIKTVRGFPKSDSKYRVIKKEVLKRYEASRIRGKNIYWTYLDFKKKGIFHDIMEDKYEKIKTLTLDDMEAFYNRTVKDRGHTILLLGDRNKIDMKAVAEFGAIIELDEEGLFGY